MKSNGIVRQAADLLHRGECFVRRQRLSEDDDGFVAGFDQGHSRGNGLGIYGEQNKRR